MTTEGKKIIVTSIGMKEAKSLGEQFVEHYPSMFTEDIEWWAQTLDEHFTSKEISYTETDMEKCFKAGVDFARNMDNPSNSEYQMIVKAEKLKSKNL